MAKLSKVQIYAIEWLNHIGYTAEQISEDINIPHKQIDKILLSKTTETTSIETSRKNTESKKNMLITHTAGKKMNTVAIMTKEASAMSDEDKQKTIGHSRDTSKNIFRPNK